MEPGDVVVENLLCKCKIQTLTPPKEKKKSSSENEDSLISGKNFITHPS
jgi:hypothetical protein